MLSLTLKKYRRFFYFHLKWKKNTYNEPYLTLLVVIFFYQKSAQSIRFDIYHEFDMLLIKLMLFFRVNMAFNFIFVTGILSVLMK